jgi:NADPH-dependent 7-cyano-7-deazaguanine reductase QueF
MKAPTVVPCAAKVMLSITGPLTHLCPFVEEVDEGTITITWTTDHHTLELHSVREWLGQFADTTITHEQLTADIRTTLSRLAGIDNVQVVTAWSTAGFAVTAADAR